MKRRVFWILLISGIVSLIFNLHFRSIFSIPTSLNKEYGSTPSQKNTILTIGNDVQHIKSIEDNSATANRQSALSNQATGTEVHARGLGAKEQVNRAVINSTDGPVIVTGVEYWLAPDQTQVVINLDRSLSNEAYRTYTLQDPPRLVVELTQGKSSQGKETIQVYDKAIKTIRLQRLMSGRFQVVFDLIQSQPKFKVFQITKVPNEPDRIMVNISHSKEKEPELKKEPPVVRNGGQQNYKVVVIDPGHGGIDSGAIGRSGAMEKHIVLNISRKLKNYLEQTKDIKVYLTRDSDYFLSLGRRTQIARERSADLFVSIHVNANYDSNRSGFSVYCLSQQATDEAAKLLAQRENASDHIGGVIFNQEDPTLNEILWDLSQSESLNRSLEFGVLTLDKAIPALKVRNEGLKRANFAVLRAPDVPSVLIEALYISNSYEEQLLTSPGTQNRIAEALYQSIISYFERFNPVRPDKKGKEPLSKNREVSIKSTRPNNLFPVNQAVQEDKPFDRSSVIRREEYRTHVVKEGETLWRIANLYKVEAHVLAEINQLKGQIVYAGQKLGIP